jgi:hypothetical protein
MTAIVHDVAELIGPLPEASDDGPLLVEFPNAVGPELAAAFRKLWGMVLCMAVRDGAESVRYRPWRDERILTYVIGWQQYEFVPPPPQHANLMIEVARQLFTPPPTLIERVFGRGGAACGTFTAIAGEAVVWDAVCWSSGERGGVELYRVTPIDPTKVEAFAAVTPAE